MKRQTTEWKKIFANHISNEGLTYKIYKRTQTTGQQKTNLILKWEEDLNRYFFKEGTQVVHEKVCSITNHQGNASHNHGKLSTHTCQTGYHQNVCNECWWKCGEKGALGALLIRMQTGAAPMGNSTSENLKNYHVIQQFHFWVFIWRK